VCHSGYHRRFTFWHKHPAMVLISAACQAQLHAAVNMPFMDRPPVLCLPCPGRRRQASAADRIEGNAPPPSSERLDLGLVVFDIRPAASQSGSAQARKHKPWSSAMLESDLQHLLA
jgi:hypothetical protein